MGVIFNIQKLSVIDFVLTDTRNLPGKRPKSACGKSSNCRFLFSAARISITKAAEYVALDFFRILVFFPFYESFDVTVFKRWWFFSVLVAIIRQNYDKRPWIENGEGFAVHSSTWRSCAKGEWRVSGWLAISNRREKISFFSISDFAAFLRAGNPCRRHNKYFIYRCFEKSCGKKSVKKHAEISLVLFSFTSGFQRNLRKVIVGTRHRRLDEVIYLNC